MSKMSLAIRKLLHKSPLFAKAVNFNICKRIGFVRSFEGGDRLDFLAYDD